jgi:hypothetical protein
MTCRKGEHYTGPWSAPPMMALEGANIGLQLGGTATDFVLLGEKPPWCRRDPFQQGQVGRRRFSSSRRGGERRASNPDVLPQARISVAKLKGTPAKFVAVGFKPGIIGPRLPLVRPNREGTSDEIAAQENDERGNRTTFQGGTRAAAGVRLTDAGRERFTASDGIRPLHTRISSGAVALEAVHGQVA